MVNILEVASLFKARICKVIETTGWPGVAGRSGFDNALVGHGMVNMLEESKIENSGNGCG